MKKCLSIFNQANWNIVVIIENESNFDRLNLLLKVA